MTKFNQRSFSSPANSKKFIDNFNRVFGIECSMCEGEGFLEVLHADTDGDLEQVECGNCGGPGYV